VFKETPETATTMTAASPNSELKPIIIVDITKRIQIAFYDKIKASFDEELKESEESKNRVKQLNEGWSNDKKVRVVISRVERFKS